MHDEALLNNYLNFGDETEKAKLNAGFSPDGVKSAQRLYVVEDKGFGDNLEKLTEYVGKLPATLRPLMPVARWLSRRQVRKIRQLKSR